MNCFFHKFLGCSPSKDVVGMSPAGYRRMRRACPRACGLCGEDSPSAVPSLAPTRTCRDDPAYRSKHGWICAQFSHNPHCQDMQKIGFTLREVQELVRRCTRSCGGCGAGSPSSPPSWLFSDRPSAGPSAGPTSRPNGVPSPAPSALPVRALSDVPSTGPTAGPTSRLSGAPSSSDGPSAVPSSAPSRSCHDDPSYRSKHGWACAQFRHNLRCRDLQKIGFAPTEVRELIRRCTWTCGGCGADAPSLTPSELSSARPSAEPSAGPTSRPNGSPSAVPSALPVGTPSAVPTRAPSVLPISPPSVAPSGAPRAAHSAAPTTRPSAVASPVPTAIPSAAPTPRSTPQPTGESCRDDPAFVSKNNIRCSLVKKWALTSCSLLFDIGFLLEEIEDIVWHCQGSCGCRHVRRPVPSERPTGVPTGSQSEHPTGIPRRDFRGGLHEDPTGTATPPLERAGGLPHTAPQHGLLARAGVCKDDGIFLNSEGLGCALIQKLYLPSCYSLTAVGFRADEIAEFNHRCPRGCRICGPDRVRFAVVVGERRAPSGAPTGASSGMCQDDPTFTAASGLGCALVQKLYLPSCHGLVAMGFDAGEIGTFIDRCPRGCGLCATGATASPSAVPWAEPSRVPSAARTTALSSAPTDVPSGVRAGVLSSPPTAGLFRPPGACFDDPYFSSNSGLGCTLVWRLPCRSLADVGFGPEEIGAFYEHCPRSCGVCVAAPSGVPSRAPLSAPTGGPTHISSRTPSVVPTSAPLSVPSEIPTDSISLAPSNIPSISTSLPTMVEARPCADSDAYRSPFGQTCPFYEGINCAQMWVIGFDLRQIREMETACPATCGHCPGMDGDGGAGDAGHRGVVLHPSAAGYGSAVLPPVCDDDPMYRSPFRTPCSFFQGLLCDSMTFWGMNDDQLEELMERCPFSCKMC